MIDSLSAITFAIVDAFVEKEFSGNPAAVCELKKFLPDHVLQAIAAEHNLSETAFLVRRGPSRYALRWFTPLVEVDLCGHATLAAAHFLFTHQRESPGILHFDTRSGELKVRRDDEYLWLDFPAWPVNPVSVEPEWVSHFGSCCAAGRNAADYLLLELADAGAGGGYQPEATFLARIAAFGTVLTAPGSSHGPDFVSRFFAPRAGILEDPVTGSAHCSLFPYWAKKTGRTSLRARQLSPRGGLIEGVAVEERILLGGRCHTHAIGRIARTFTT